jgi:hypothetical protein
MRELKFIIIKLIEAPMPFILSPKISIGSSAMWMEGAAYEKKALYSISSGKLPPVN